MANTVITSTTNAVKFVFNDDVPLVGPSKRTWPKSAIMDVYQNGNHVGVEHQDGMKFMFDLVGGEGHIPIDTVGGVGVASLSDLYDKISALIE